MELDLTEEQREELAKHALEAKVKIAAGVASGVMECLFCAADVHVDKGEDNRWQATCRCGWSASGIGNFTGSLN